MQGPVITSYCLRICSTLQFLGINLQKYFDFQTIVYIPLQEQYHVVHTNNEPCSVFIYVIYKVLSYLLTKKLF